MADPDPDLARQLYNARESAHLTQDQLAKKLGISRVQVGRIETGKRGTYAALVRKWLHACGYTLDSVAVGDSPRTGELADVIAEISDDDLDIAIRLMKVLPKLGAFPRKVLFDILEAHETQP